MDIGKKAELLYNTAAIIYKEVWETEKLTYIYDTQMLVEGEHLSEERIREHLLHEPPGDCLLVVGDEKLLRVHFHTNEPWAVMKYLSQFGTVYDITIENMEKQQEEFIK